MKVEIKYVDWLQDQIAKINNCHFDVIEWYENGLKLEISKETAEEFKFCGLSNKDFARSRFWEGLKKEEIIIKRSKKQ